MTLSKGTLLSTATPSVLVRVLAYSGFLAAAVLVVNTLKRAGVLPLTPATQLLAPFGQLFSIALILALFAAVVALRGRLGSIGVVIYVGALASLVGVEYVINLVLPYLDRSTIDELLAGPLGIALAVASISFLVGTIVFYAALWRVPGSPKAAIVLIVLGTIPIALRMSFPEVVLQLGLALVSAGVVLVTVWLVRRNRAVQRG